MSMRQHQRKVLAQRKQQQAKAVNQQSYKAEYKKWLGKLKADQIEIKQFPDHDDRNALAGKKIDSYLDYLCNWLEADNTHQNDVLTQAVVWATDAQRWDVLFELADPAIANPKIGNLHWMERDLADFVASEIIKQADAQKKAGEVTAPVQEILERIEDERWSDVNHVAKARYHKFCGLQAMEDQKWATAIDLLNKADELYPKIGVKGHLKTAIDELKGKSKIKAQKPEKDDTKPTENITS